MASVESEGSRYLSGDVFDVVIEELERSCAGFKELSGDKESQVAIIDEYYNLYFEAVRIKEEEPEIEKTAEQIAVEDHQGYLEEFVVQAEEGFAGFNYDILNRYCLDQDIERDFCEMEEEVCKGNFLEPDPINLQSYSISGHGVMQLFSQDGLEASRQQLEAIRKVNLITVVGEVCPEFRVLVANNPIENMRLQNSIIERYEDIQADGRPFPMLRHYSELQDSGLGHVKLPYDILSQRPRSEIPDDTITLISGQDICFEFLPIDVKHEILDSYEAFEDDGRLFPITRHKEFMRGCGLGVYNIYTSNNIQVQGDMHERYVLARLSMIDPEFRGLSLDVRSEIVDAFKMVGSDVEAHQKCMAEQGYDRIRIDYRAFEEAPAIDVGGSLSDKIERICEVNKDFSRLPKDLQMMVVYSYLNFEVQASDLTLREAEESADITKLAPVLRHKEFMKECGLGYLDLPYVSEVVGGVSLSDEKDLTLEGQRLIRDSIAHNAKISPEFARLDFSAQYDVIDSFRRCSQLKEFGTVSMHQRLLANCSGFDVFDLQYCSDLPKTVESSRPHPLPIIRMSQDGSESEVFVKFVNSLRVRQLERTSMQRSRLLGMGYTDQEIEEYPGSFLRGASADLADNLYNQSLDRMEKGMSPPPTEIGFAVDGVSIDAQRKRIIDGR